MLRRPVRGGRAYSHHDGRASAHPREKGAVTSTMVDDLAQVRSQVVTTTYLGQAGFDQIDAAQAEFDAHIVSSSDGLCRTCRNTGCPGQAVAVRTLARYGRLPRRRPGATQPERIGLRSIGGSWFSPSAAVTAAGDVV
jgi:hypothetical protein